MRAGHLDVGGFVFDNDKLSFFKEQGRHVHFFLLLVFFRHCFYFLATVFHFLATPPSFCTKFFPCANLYSEARQYSSDAV
jgi:hypothetical protein